MLLASTVTTMNHELQELLNECLQTIQQLSKEEQYTTTLDVLCLATYLTQITAPYMVLTLLAIQSGSSQIAQWTIL